MITGLAQSEGVGVCTLTFPLARLTTGGRVGGLQGSASGVMGKQKVVVSTMEGNKSTDPQHNVDEPQTLMLSARSCRRKGYVLLDPIHVPRPERANPQTQSRGWLPAARGGKLGTAANRNGILPGGDAGTLKPDARGGCIRSASA